MSDIQHTDVLVIGGGLAGLSAAKNIAHQHVTIMSNVHPGLGGSSSWAQGGVAVALGDDDDATLHLEDTLRVGVGLSLPERVELLVREGIPRVTELLEMGVPFDRDENGEIHLGREAAHSRRRIVHAGGDRTGSVIMQQLSKSLADGDGGHVQWLYGQALDLIVHRGRVVGIIYLNQTKQLSAILASSVVLATGGMGQLYQWTTNPVEAAGDGLAMAVRAGASVVDLEFVQFHPTALCVDERPVPLLSEAIRGEGATLVDSQGHRFMRDVHPDAELAPRDVVARAIALKLAQGDTVFLDISTLTSTFETRFPAAFKACTERGIDLSLQKIPVTPAAHYHMGGIAVDEYSRSTMPGLWACGEVASTGIHGANRLASNSLLEALVFGARAGLNISEQGVVDLPQDAAKSAQEAIRRWTHAPPHDACVNQLDEQLRALMWHNVGVVRTEKGLLEALERMDQFERQLNHSLSWIRNRLLVSRLITQSALNRTESRGAHYRADFIHQDPSCVYRLFVHGTHSRREVIA